MQLELAWKMLFLSWFWVLAAASSAKRPNILLLTTDQQRLDTMGCYGSTFAKSPNIDRLAAEGVRYTHSYTASPVCQSARASWLTGTQVPVHKVWGNGLEQYHQTDAHEMITSLKKAGYFTAAIGKTHYYPVPDYDHLDAHTGNTDMRKPNMPAAEFLETYLVNQTMLLLENQLLTKIGPHQPWFVHLSFISPHPPSNVPLEWQDMYLHADIPNVTYGGPEERAAFPHQLKSMYNDFEGAKYDEAFPGGYPDHKVINEFRRNYFALANYVDHQVGRIMEFLKYTGWAEDTYVIFTSDHGTNLWDHGLDEKYNFFDESWQVPLILRGPGLPQGAVEEFAAGVDVSSTILAVAQAEHPPGLNGFDLVGPLVRGEAPQRTHGVAGSLLQGYAVVTREWKLTFYLDDRRGQLFDRVHDKEELVNLFDNPKYGAVKMQLLAALLSWRAGLEPVEWLQPHLSPTAKFPNAKFVQEYTMNLTGREPEVQLQADLSLLDIPANAEVDFV
eukprot:TRINITY_DN10258_c0_g1_i2.p1 TRINITY_DN10258_c0_g1~~TRINITY_DN10258_c0_g1_i2.p1  ORF type:complete len:501 (-),score=87.66 TRINITY_DN10258_c0_g1_i2:317-1819(-)